MNYLDRVATDIWREVSQDNHPGKDTEPLFRIYAVLALAKGTEVTLAGVHNAWSAWKIERDPEHESIQPFDMLSPDAQREDDRYAKAIHRVAARLPRPVVQRVGQRLCNNRSKA